MQPKNKLKLISRNSVIDYWKSGSKIKIKKQNQGKFTDYCGGAVTEECIQKGKHSSDPKIRKRANFAANARKWKHESGGILFADNGMQTPVVHRNPSIAKDFQNVIEEGQKNLNRMAQQQMIDNWMKQQQREQTQALASNIGSTVINGLQQFGTSIVDKRASKPSKFGTPIKEDAANSGYANTVRQDAPIAAVQNTEEEKKRREELQKMLEAEQNETKIDNPILDIVSPIYEKSFLQNPSVFTTFMKKGGKSLVKKNVHKPFGHTSILDDVGKVNPKTLKLK